VLAQPESALATTPLRCTAGAIVESMSFASLACGGRHVLVTAPGLPSPTLNRAGTTSETRLFRCRFVIFGRRRTPRDLLWHGDGRMERLPGVTDGIDRAHDGHYPSRK